MNDTIALLDIFQSQLGSSREACDEAGKLLWDRIKAARIGQTGACLYADTLDKALMEVMNGDRKASKMPIEPMVRLIHFARTGTVTNATIGRRDE